MTLPTVIPASIVLFVCVHTVQAELASRTESANFVQGESLRRQVETDQQAEVLSITIARDDWRQVLYRAALVEGFAASDVGEQAHAALLRAHLPTAVIGEEAVRRGRLDDYESLVLMQCQYLPRSVADRIAAFINAGGKVYCDSGTKVPLDGLTRLPFDFTQHREQVAKSWAGQGYRDSRAWEPHVRRQAQHLSRKLPAVKTWYHVDDFDTVARGLDLPGARMLYLVNASIQNYAADATDRVDPIAVNPTVTVPAGSAVYDLLQHNPVAVEPTAAGAKWQAHIPGGGGAIFLVADQPMGPANIKAPSTVTIDTQLDVCVSVRTADGKVSTAQIAVTAP